MAKQVMRITRGKLLVDLATKKKSVNQDVGVEECTRPSPSSAASSTNLLSALSSTTHGELKDDHVCDEKIQGIRQDMGKVHPVSDSELPSSSDTPVTECVIPMPHYDITHDHDKTTPSSSTRCVSELAQTIEWKLQDNEEDQLNDLESTTAQPQEEFVLFPSDQENVFILKPITKSSPLVEDFDQRSTWDDENCFLPTVNINDMSFDLEHIISEEIIEEENNFGKQTDNTIQEIPDERHVQSENATTPEAQNENYVQEKNTIIQEILGENYIQEKNTTIQEILDENYEQTDNTQSQEIVDDIYEPTDLEEVDSHAEELQEMEGNENAKRKRKRNKKPMKHSWESEQNKTKRMKGEDYFGRRKNSSNKHVFDVKRPKRKLKPRCQCKAKPNSQFKCYKFSEVIRGKLFKNFWQLDWKERKVLVKQLVDRRSICNRRVNSVEFRRKGSLYYHLNIDDNEERVRVCKKMFLNTLSVGEWSVTNWVSNPSAIREEGDNSEERDDIGQNGDVNNESDQLNVQSVNSNKKAKEDSIRKKIIKEFFDKLPKLESHYCRKNTRKLYLEPNWQSKAQLYRYYRGCCESEGKEEFIASDCLFYSLFDELNLGLFSPKKDQCDLCSSFNKGNLTKELYEEHIKKKDEARSEKDADKETSDERTAVYTMDMQAVLLSPSLKASALYYKTKLKVHNYTFYDLKTNDAFCYIWNESEGGLDADEFASITTHFIVNEVDRSKYDNVILYSDGCTYQNRNCVLSNALLLTSSKTGLTITQKFLEKGHTQMECDSMHSVIERKLRNREIYSPAGYVEVCKTARLSPRPYKVNYLDHTFFRKYNNLHLVTSIRPGKKKGDPLVTNLRVIEYKPEGTIKFKLNFSDVFSDLPQRIKKPPYEVSLKRLHEKQIPIKSRLYKDLQSLKNVLPRDVHGFYDDLPHYKNESKSICGEEGSCTCSKIP